ncbi:Hypothetical protein SRAE_1000163700 [Strongyloides ratti]|uniref:Uncharacterized protein n=1 Tax=Strongyloides ratti TaxID=34506 RepID=A0A090L0R4_STRRB|nr:Hypothetical protein SRAE_1000163700 [Strongyloides ratti]CEF63375.1 Hypothetical protein SRAE_1000163700 [Strongyloides ratti]
MFSIKKFLILVTLSIVILLAKCNTIDDVESAIENSVENFAGEIENVIDSYLTERDFTDNCREIANVGGDNQCQIFNMCCSPTMMLNPNFGDMCQEADQSNGCRVTEQGIFMQCKARKCNKMKPTTTTTEAPYSEEEESSNSSSIISLGSGIIFTLLCRFAFLS